MTLLACLFANTSTKSSRFMALALLDSTLNTPKSFVTHCISQDSLTMYILVSYYKGHLFLLTDVFGLINHNAVGLTLSNFANY